KSARRTPRSVRPRLEALEDRCLLSAGVLDPTFNPAGSPAGTFAGALSGGVSDVLVQPSGNIVLAGTTYNSQGDAVFGAAELNSSGSLVSSFGSGGTVVPSFKGKWRPYSPSDATLYPTGSPGDEKILEAGWAVNSSWTQPGAFALVRYNANGSL